MSKTLVIMTGLQGSGKSTFYSKYLSADYVRINLDTLKTRYQEKLMIEKCLSESLNYAVDNTNPTRADRERYIIPAKEAGYRIVGYYIDASVAYCLQRNAQRDGKARVPDVAIYATAKKLEIPSYDEGFDELYIVKNDGETMTVGEYQE